jgi:hypothetical protein
MERIHSSETYVHFHRTIRHYIPEEIALYSDLANINSSWYDGVLKLANSEQTMHVAWLTFQDGIHGTAVQRVPKVMNGRHEEDFLGSLWQEVNN